MRGAWFLVRCEILVLPVLARRMERRPPEPTGFMNVLCSTGSIPMNPYSQYPVLKVPGRPPPRAAGSRTRKEEY